MSKLKRALDLTLVLLSLPFVVVPGFLLGIAVLARVGWPVFFVQERPGLNCKIFRLVKFRTMTDQRDGAGALLPDSVRLMPFGKWLRSTSLDELPCLFNVLKGEMSLVGPRPLLVEYLPLYSSTQARRHEVRPGVTGWAQVNGRNTITWERKFDLDVWYIDNQSIWLDIRILFITMKKVFVRDGINAQNDATMPRFTGSK